MTKRRADRVHRTTIVVTVLSEGPLPHMALDDVAHEMSKGACLGQIRWTPSEPLADKEVPLAEQELGGDGTFFKLH